MSTTVSNSGAGSSGQANFSSSPTDPELDPQAAEKALQALNDGTFSNIKQEMQQWKTLYDGKPTGSGGGSLDQYNYATSQTPPVKPWWQTYEPIAAINDNCSFSPFHQFDQNIVNGPTVTLWACFFGVQTGYADPNKQGADWGGHDGEYYHDSSYTVSNPTDSISQMISALKGKIDIIDTNILGVSNDPEKVQKLNVLRCQVQTGLDAAVKLDNWRNSVMAWNARAGVSNYDMLKPCKYGDGYSGPKYYYGDFSTQEDNAQQREDFLWTKIGAGPNNNDPYPRPPFDPFELAAACYQTCSDMSNPW